MDRQRQRVSLKFEFSRIFYFELIIKLWMRWKKVQEILSITFQPISLSCEKKKQIWNNRSIFLKRFTNYKGRIILTWRNWHTVNPVMKTDISQNISHPCFKRKSYLLQKKMCHQIFHSISFGYYVMRISITAFAYIRLQKIVKILYLEIY